MAKLSEKEIIAKLQALKSQVHPGSVWVDFCRDWLSQKIELNEQIIALSNIEKKKIWIPTFAGITENIIGITRRAFAPAMAMCAILALSSTGLVFASKDSLPGDLLFSIKVVYEKTQMLATPTSKRAELQIHITNARLQDLDKLVTADKKSGNSIIEAVKQLNNELVAVKKQLPEMAQNKQLKEAVKIAETATDITNKISTTAVIIDSSCDSFASSSCAVAEKNNQELPAVQTMKMAEEIMKNIEELSKKESSMDEPSNLDGEPNDLR